VGWRSKFRYRAFDPNDTRTCPYELSNPHPRRPWWLGFDVVHEGYRQNLVFKDPAYYRMIRLVPDTSDEKPPYAWPVSNGEWSLLESDHPDTTRVRLIRYKRPRVIEGRVWGVRSPFGAQALCLETRDKRQQRVRWLLRV
jgi:hypothetical protein